MKDLVYLVISCRDNDEWIEEYDTLKKANYEAMSYWYHLTNNEKKRSRVYVMVLEKEDYLKVKNDETESWYGDFEVEVDGYDSDLEKGYGKNQETAYVICNGNDRYVGSKIFNTLEEAKEMIKVIPKEVKYYYKVVPVGKKDAEIFLKELTTKRMEDYIIDFDPIFSTDDIK